MEQNWLMHYKDKELERLFIEDWGRKRQTHDLVWLCLISFINLGLQQYTKVLSVENTPGPARWYEQSTPCW